MKKPNINDLYDAIENCKNALNDALELAQEIAMMGEGFGGEIAKTVSSQMLKYFIPNVGKFIDDASTAGSLAPLITFLDSVPLSMTRQTQTPQEMAAAVSAKDTETLVAPEEMAPIENAGEEEIAPVDASAVPNQEIPGEVVDAGDIPPDQQPLEQPLNKQMASAVRAVDSIMKEFGLSKAEAIEVYKEAIDNQLNLFPSFDAKETGETAGHDQEDLTNCDSKKMDNPKMSHPTKSSKKKESWNDAFGADNVSPSTTDVFDYEDTVPVVSEKSSIRDDFIDGILDPEQTVIELMRTLDIDEYSARQTVSSWMKDSDYDEEFDPLAGYDPSDF